MPALRVLSVVSALGVLLAVYQAFQQRLWPLATAAGLYLLVSIGGVAYAALLQRFVVAPNEQTRETPYHRPQHRGDARRLRAVDASTSASCRATPS